MSSYQLEVTGGGDSWKASLTIRGRTIHAYGTSAEEATDLVNLMAGSETSETMDRLPSDLREGDLRQVEEGEV